MPAEYRGTDDLWSGSGNGRTTVPQRLMGFIMGSWFLTTAGET